MTPDLRTLARSPARDGRLGFGLYLVPGYPSWTESLSAVRTAVARGIDFVEFPIMRGREFSASTGGTVAEALSAAEPGALDPGSGRLRQWLAQVPGPVGVVYGSAWPSPDDWRAPGELAAYCSGLICEHDARPFPAFARRARQWNTALVPTLRAGTVTVEPGDAAALEHGDGFVYLALSGRTGRSGPIGPTLARKITAVRSQRPELPVYAAFGIRRPADAEAVARHGADGFVVGSHALHLLATGGPDAFADWLDAMLAARSTPVT